MFNFLTRRCSRAWRWPSWGRSRGSAWTRSWTPSPLCRLSRHTPLQVRKYIIYSVSHIPFSPIDYYIKADRARMIGQPVCLRKCCFGIFVLSHQYLYFITLTKQKTYICMWNYTEVVVQRVWVLGRWWEVKNPLYMCKKRYRNSSNVSFVYMFNHSDQTCRWEPY